MTTTTPPRSLEELKAEFAEQTSGTVFDWLAALVPEERRALEMHFASVNAGPFREPHDAVKRAAAARMRQYATAPVDDDQDDDGDVVDAGDHLSDILTPNGKPKFGDIEDDLFADVPGPAMHDAIREAYAAGRARAAADAAGVRINVVITFADAVRNVAYRAVYAVGRRLLDLAQRIAPTR